MPFEHDIGDSTPKDNRERNENWQAVGDLARKLVQEMADRKAREASE